MKLGVVVAVADGEASVVGFAGSTITAPLYAHFFNPSSDAFIIHLIPSPN
jgi:hypothetical protein